MSHLSSEEISGVLLGEDSRHARECVKCRGEVERFESALRLFRSGMTEISERTPNYRFLAPLESGSYRRREAAAGLWSLMFHGAAIAGILVIGSLKPVNTILKQTIVPLFAPPPSPYKPAPDTAHGGGGGGHRQPIDANVGKLPKFSPRPFVPPQVDVAENPKLPMTPAIMADAPNIVASNYGDPLSHLGVPSNGPGCCAGIGGGDGIGVGIGHGPGAGDGSGGWFGKGIARVGGGVSSPVILLKVEPEYSEEARKARFQGVVKMEVVVDEHGLPRQFKVLRPAGMGLDEKAMEAVAKWRFKPGMKDGKPIPVIAVIEVTFRLL